MNSEKRNANVVGVLFIALTVGAGALLLMEPRAQRWKPDALLMAHSNAPIESVLIECLPLDARVDPGQYDCIVPADGAAPTWNPRGSKIRVLVEAGPDDRIPLAQKEALLGLIGGLVHGSGLDLRRVQLAEGSDPRHAAGVPPQARDLCTWLLAKGFVQ